MMLVFALELAFLKHAHLTGICLHFKVIQKIELFEELFPNLSCNKMTSCKNSDITYFSDTATSTRPLKNVKTFQAQVSKLPSGPSRC